MGARGDAEDRGAGRDLLLGAASYRRSQWPGRHRLHPAVRGNDARSVRQWPARFARGAEVMTTTNERTCVIGAGGAGLAALRALRLRGIAVDCFERGSDVGGNWRYENDSGTSSAYASLHTNVSRPRMQFPSFPMPKSFGDFVHHADMARYFEAYARKFRLYPHIQFS